MNEFDEQYEKYGISAEDARNNWSEILRVLSNDPSIPAIARFWHNDDVNYWANNNCEFNRTLTAEECQEVLQRVSDKFDAESGINWDVIDFWIEELSHKHTLQCGCGHVVDFKFIGSPNDSVIEKLEKSPYPECE